MPGQILLDFDGTIAIEDTTDCLLERFAEPRWREVEEAWEAQLIGSRECLARQVDLVRASEDEHRALHRRHPYRPRLSSLSSRPVRRRSFHVMVVSDGLDRIVRGVIARTGVELPIAANRLEHLGRRPLAARFPACERQLRQRLRQLQMRARVAGHARPAHRGGRRALRFLRGRRAPITSSPRGACEAICVENGIAHAADRQSHRGDAPVR